MWVGRLGAKLAAVLVAGAVLTACGGNDDPFVNTNAAPIANAGANQTVAPGAVVTLHGSGTDSDGTIASLAWTQVDGPPVTLSSNSAANPTFTAPAVAAPTILRFRLTVRDNGGSTGTNTTVVTVTPGGANTAPTANAGADKSANSGAVVPLPGSGTDTDGTITGFLWTQTGGTAVTLSNANTATASFTAPTVGAATPLTFTLRVTDNGGATDTDSIVVTVQPAGANVAPTANAGPDQTRPSATATTLTSAGSADPDGTIASFAWSQTGGPAVVLTGANTATATFTTPTVAANTDLTFQLLVTDNAGATDTDTTVVTVTPAAPPGTVNVSGKVTFDRVPQDATGALDYGSISQEPARGITVQAMNAAGTTVLDTAVTDALGNYTLTVAQNTSVIVRALSEMVDTGAGPSWDFSVVDNTAGDALYKVDTAAFNSGTTTITNKNINAASGFNAAGTVTGARNAAPFAILDTMFDAFNTVLAVDPTTDFPTLTVHWSPNNTTATAAPGADPCDATGAIGSTFYAAQHICLLGAAGSNTDEYDADVVLREFAHYLLDQFSRYDKIAGFPGDHNEGDRLDMRIAFGEGFAKAFTGMVGDGVYQESFGPSQSQGFSVDLENNAITNPGWYSEGSVSSILYDIFDGASDAGDTVNLGFGAIWDVLLGSMRTGDALTSIFPFVTELKANNAPAAGAINTLVAGQDIVSSTINPFGSTETNSAGAGTDVLPVYTDLTLNAAAPVNLCNDNAFGEFNKLGDRRFLKFTLAAPTTVNFTITGGTDPDALVFEDGNQVASGLSGAPGSETFSQALPAGVFVMEVTDFTNDDNDPTTGG
ncbi:MAG TPA: PKD domain-containing protein, partial [Solimonas sp.]|nr:PKD domain-containing protein [Solimonas sp.]